MGTNEQRVTVGEKVYIVDETGGTFAFASPYDADEFYDNEMRDVAAGLERFAIRAPQDGTLSELAEHACEQGWDGTSWNAS